MSLKNVEWRVGVLRKSSVSTANRKSFLCPESWCIEQEMGVYTKQKELLMSRALLGNNKCTWGPAHWCATKSNAAACGKGAEAHCAKVGYADEQMVASRALVGGS